jgi:hypothetical protein
MVNLPTDWPVHDKTHPRLSTISFEWSFRILLKRYKEIYFLKMKTTPNGCNFINCANRDSTIDAGSSHLYYITIDTCRGSWLAKQSSLKMNWNIWLAWSKSRRIEIWLSTLTQIQSKFKFHSLLSYLLIILMNQLKSTNLFHPKANNRGCSCCNLTKDMMLRMTQLTKRLIEVFSIRTRILRLIQLWFYWNCQSKGNPS